MKIHQYIYTRLSKHDSPWDKAGFQSAFLPKEFPDRSNAIDLESFIHRPEGDSFASKHVVFWKEFKGELYQVIYFLDDLPGETDEFGRGGIFMCHGFLIPSAVWKRYRRPLALASELEAYRYHSIEALLDSPYVDTDLGTIAPVELDEDDLAAPSVRANPLSETESQILNVLAGLAMDREGGPRHLVIKGAPWQVEKLLDRVFAYLPEPARTALGWDSGFDGGKMQFSPFKIFGYDEMEPVTGNPIRLDLDTGGFEPGEFGAKALEAPDAFTRWMGSCLEVEQTWVYLDQMGLLAEKLEKREAIPAGLPFDGCFATANAVLVQDSFLAGLESTWIPAWLELLVAENPPEKQLKALLSGFAAADLSGMLENAILRQKIRPAAIAKAPPASAVAAGSPLLQQLATMWSSDPLDPASVQHLSPGDRQDWLRLASGSPLADSPHFVELVLAEKEALPNLKREPAIRARLESHFEARLYPQLKPLSRAMMDQLMEKEPVEVLGESTPDWLRVLEHYLATLGIPLQDIRNAAALREQISADKLRNYPFLEACLYPAGNVAARLGDYKLRAACLRVLIHGLNMQERALRDLGFEREEITDINPDAGGLLGKVRKLFGN
jgi:hypothetical protein